MSLVEIVDNRLHVEPSLEEMRDHPYRCLDLVFDLIDLDKSDLISKIQDASGLSKELILEHYEKRCGTPR